MTCITKSIKVFFDWFIFNKMMTTNVEDPIYSAARKRRREWENIANKVKSLESKTPCTTDAKPYNMRDKKKSEPVSKKMKDGDFHEHQVALYCGLHAIHNLFREDTWPTVEEMNNVAIQCANESGDKIYNHKSFGGYWSMDTIIRVLQSHDYLVDNMVDTKISKGKTIYIWKHAIGTMCSLLDNEKAIGFIIHQPQHYTALRKNLNKDAWQYSNSYNLESKTMNPHDFCKQALDGVWNIYLVRKK